MNQRGQLKAFLSHLGIDTHIIPEDVLALSINNLQINSNNVQKNDLFIALKGQCVDGYTYVGQAITNGACLVLHETESNEKNKNVTYLKATNGHKIPIISIYQLTKQLSAIANFFYDNPSKMLRLVGVTGTNGKTTVTQLLAQWVDLLGEKAAVMGTIGNGICGQLTPSANTTMSAVEVQSQLAGFVKKKVKFVAMEVSSHGLAEGRVAGISFNSVIFTNLSHDHLDFHGSMMAYALAKRKLFDEAVLTVRTRGVAVINYDDPIGKKWLKTLKNTVAISINTKEVNKLERYANFVGVSRIDYQPLGTKVEIVSSWGNAILDSPLIGEFNVSNLLVALAALLSLDYPLSKLIKKTSQLRPVPGRMERFVVSEKPVVIIDYAHTPDALSKALQAARKHCLGQLWVIFGCGGDRDRDKRPMMAKAAEKFADRIMLTHDNPRTENGLQIITDILQGFTKKKGLFIEPVRDKAIKKVIFLANAEDTILIAGKGHEDYQIIGTTKFDYSDRSVVASLLGLPL